MKLLSSLAARFREASTYAGLAALFAAVASALDQSGVARDVALFGAIAAGIGAIAKSENNVALANVMDQAVKLAPVLTKVLEAAEAARSSDQR